jgi:opacity protein-like surface antigen
MKRALLAGLALLAATAPAAAADAPRWALRARGLWTDYSNSSSYSASLGFSTLDLQGEGGAEAALELRQTPRVGWELSAGRMSFETDARSFQYVPDFSTNPVTVRPVLLRQSSPDFETQQLGLALLFHFAPASRLDWYAGPQLAWVEYAIDTGRLSRRKPEIAAGAKLGVEVPLGASAWSAGLEVRYSETQYEEQERDLYGNLGIASAAVGVSYRFPR